MGAHGCTFDLEEMSGIEGEVVVGNDVCCLLDPMPTHCTITHFGFHARWINGVKFGLFSNHAPLGQTILCVGQVSV